VNPRGNGRGGRGVWVTQDSVYVAAYNKVDILDRDLQLKRSVSNGLVTGVHEVLMTDPGRLWITATDLDAVLELDLDDGQLCRSYWPRDMEPLQEALGFPPGDVDKSADLRTTFLLRNDGDKDRRSGARVGHLHLNAVAMYRGEMLALLNRFGAIVNLDQARVVLRDDSLRGAHNLLIRDHLLFTNATRAESVHVYDLRTGDLVRTYPLRDHAWVKAVTRPSLSARTSRWLRDVAGKPPLANPLFLRGMDVQDSHLYVGISPASIVCIDIESGGMVEGFQYSSDVRDCVHGLRIDA
jgi:hypothetical protein